MPRQLAIMFALTFTLAQPALAAAPAEGGASPFAGTIYQAVAAAIVFIVVFAVLKLTAWNKMLEGIQARENKIKHDLEHAEQSALQAANTLREYQAKLAAAQEEARKIIDQSRTDAQKVAAGIERDAQMQITAMRQRAESDINAAKDAAVNDMYAQAATLATEVAGRILKRQINAEDQRQLIDESLNELRSGRN